MAKLDATWLRGSRTSVSQDCCIGCFPYMCDSCSSPCHPIWSRSLPSQTKRAYDLAAEKVTLVLRRHDGPAAILPGITQETLPSYLFPMTLRNSIYPPVPHTTSLLLLSYFLGSDCLQVHPKGTLLPPCGHDWNSNSSKWISPFNYTSKSKEVMCTWTQTENQWGYLLQKIMLYFTAPFSSSKIVGILLNVIWLLSSEDSVHLHLDLTK